jgi:hypothetical protein
VLCSIQHQSIRDYLRHVGLADTVVVGVPLGVVGELDRVVVGENLAGRPDTLASRGPEGTKDGAGVKRGHGGNGGDDHRTLEDHEGGLVVGEVAAEAVPELGNTVEASDEDENSGDE